MYKLLLQFFVLIVPVIGYAQNHIQWTYTEIGDKASQNANATLHHMMVDKYGNSFIIKHQINKNDFHSMCRIVCIDKN